MSDNMKLIMERFNNFVAEQTGAELRQKLEKEIEELEKKIEAAAEGEKADLKKKLADKKAELQRLDDSVPPGGDNVEKPTKKDKEYEKSLGS